VLSAEAGAGDLDEVVAVGQPVESGGGKRGFAEEIGRLGTVPVEVKMIEAVSYHSLMTS
jgi:hypothetical protein